MPRKNREYKKGAPHRDCRKFIIVAEGEREDEYFRYFNNLNRRVKVEIVERDGGKSAAKYLQERIATYHTKFGIEPEDLVWFVLDVDKWPRRDINELHQHCTTDANWDIAISNPCFEVWLHYHLLKAIPVNVKTPGQLKTNLNKLLPGGYNKETFAKQIKVAATNAGKADEHKDHYFPEKNNTKVYVLANQLLQFLGNNWQ
ncbi:RloB family protein [Chitinophaga agri]|uniref:RloB domain-containing protein n=1 Tax=Chitinophaga agri TaxID=2703787 RepID=A0A6B9ZBT9_9BACT|nr:RloB family protein [Chitinophaga agri]QHS59778.1 RloB domain-containing protein [Chitinophaga agri]